MFSVSAEAQNPDQSDPGRRTYYQEKKKKACEADITKEDIQRWQEEYWKTETDQSHIVLTLYFYSNITVKNMLRVRWNNVYNFSKKAFYTRSLAAKIPLAPEITRVLQSYLNRHPEIRPKDFVLTDGGAPMRTDAVFRCIHGAADRLRDILDIRQTLLHDLRDCVYQIIVGGSSIRDDSQDDAVARTGEG
jgi:hypothetical protein